MAEPLLHFLPGGSDTHEQTNGSTLGECHLRSRSEKQTQPENVAIKRHASFKVVNRNEKLRNSRVRKIHFFSVFIH